MTFWQGFLSDHVLTSVVVAAFVMVLVGVWPETKAKVALQTYDKPFPSQARMNNGH